MKKNYYLNQFVHHFYRYQSTKEINKRERITKLTIVLKLIQPIINHHDNHVTYRENDIKVNLKRARFGKEMKKACYFYLQQKLC